MFQHTPVQQQQLAKLELHQRARRVVCKLLPGQRWAVNDLSAILTRALTHTRFPLAESYGAKVESFFLVAPSGTGKTTFCTRLSAKLNKGGASYFHCIPVHSLPANPGRTVEEDFATQLVQWKDQFATARRKDPSVPPPIVVVLVDEPDHASIRVPECFRSLLEDKQVSLPPLKKGQPRRVYVLPPGWAFLFIWTPNAPGDAHLMVEPGVPRLPVHPPDGRTDWEKVRDDIVKQFGRKAPSIVKRLMTREGSATSIILLYRLSGEAKVERCSECLLEALILYKYRNGLNLRYTLELAAEIAEWSEDRVPVFTQVRNQLEDAVSHLHGALVSPGQWRCMDVQIRLQDNKLVATDYEAADEGATDALRELIAQHEQEANPGAAAEPGAPEEPLPAHSDMAAEAAPVVPAAFAAPSSIQSHFNDPRIIDSIEGFDHGADARVGVGDVSVPALAHWEAQSEIHLSDRWTPMSLPHIRSLYARAHLPLPPDTVFTSVRKALSAAAAKNPNCRWEGPPASLIKATRYRTNDFYAVWQKHAAHKQNLSGQQPLRALQSVQPYPVLPAVFPGGSWSVHALLHQQLQQQQQQQQQQMMMQLLLQQQQQQQQHQQLQMMEQLSSSARRQPFAAPQFTRSREILPLVAHLPIATIPLATWRAVSCDGEWFAPSMAAIHEVYRLGGVAPPYDMAARWDMTCQRLSSAGSGVKRETMQGLNGEMCFRTEEVFSIWEATASSGRHSGVQIHELMDLTDAEPAPAHVVSVQAPTTDRLFRTPLLPPGLPPSTVSPWQTVEQASHPPLLPRRLTSRFETTSSATPSPSAAGVRVNHDMHALAPLPSSHRSSHQLLDSKRSRIYRSSGAASTLGFDAATGSAVEKDDDEGDVWLLANARRFPPLTHDELVEAESMMQDELREYHVPEPYRRAMLKFAAAPEDRDSLDLVRRLCASTTRRIDDVEVTLWDYRLLISADTVQTVAPPIRAYIDLLNVVTHVCLDDAGRYMVVVDVPVLILLRRLMPQSIDGVSCIAFIKRFVKRGLSAAARRQPRSASNTRVQCFQVVGQMLPGRLRRAKLCFQRFAEDGPAAVLYQFHLPIAVDNLPLERWDQPDLDHRLALLELGLLHSLSAVYLEAYQQPCAQIVARSSHAGLTSFSMFAPAAHPTAAFRHACVSSAEREELDRFVRTHDRDADRDAARHQAFDSEGHELAQDCDDPDVHTLLQALHLKSQQQEDEALSREYESMQAREAEEDEALYQEHLADEQHAKAKRSRDHE